MRMFDVIRRLTSVNKDADISCIIICNGEVITYTQDEADAKTMLTLARAVKRRATIHVTG